MESVIAFLQDCRLGKKQVHRNLTIFPVLYPGALKPCYLTLEQAMDSGTLLVTEVDASGNVNRLKLRNNARQPVLLVEGEELKGAKQNRIVNASFLIAGKTVTTIPVSCVEERRWSYDTRKFRSGKKVMHASLRREAQSCLIDNLSTGAGHRSDQARIWSHIAEKSQRMNAHSPTMAMSDVFEQAEDQLTAYADSFHPMEQQAGAIFAIDGTVAGLECFGSCDTFGLFFDKLIHSYAMDAIECVETSAKTPSVQPAKAKAFVESVKKAKGQRHPVVSIGATISFESRIAAGTALAEGKRIIHMSAFRKTGKSGRNPLGFQRFSNRRDNHTRHRRSGSHFHDRPEMIE